jgi:hypothetical protein
MINAIINSGNRRLIGYVFEEGTVPGDICKVSSAYELRCQTFLLPTPQGPAMVHQNFVVTVDSEEEAVDIEVLVDNIRWFKDMKDGGRKYTLMVEQFEEVFRTARAESAGISVAKSMPNKSNRVLF